MPTLYCGRIAPSPNGWLHLGHARTFFEAWRRARDAKGTLWLRIDDLDAARCKAVYTEAAIEDLEWMGIDWDHGPAYQSQRRHRYLATWQTLLAAGHLFPCTRSRRDVRDAASAPQEGGAGWEGGPIYPTAWRPEPGTGQEAKTPAGFNWRFRVQDGQAIEFTDGQFGPQRFVAGRDFGDFLVWRRDDVPAYELAVVVDDHDESITEVVRGKDLLLSTARQLLVYKALGWTPPAWYHTELVRDETGRRLAKRDGDLGLRQLRGQGLSFQDCLRKIGIG